MHDFADIYDFLILSKGAMVPDSHCAQKGHFLSEYLHLCVCHGTVIYCYQ